MTAGHGECAGIADTAAGHNALVFVNAAAGHLEVSAVENTAAASAVIAVVVADRAAGHG